MNRFFVLATILLGLPLTACVETTSNPNNRSKSRAEKLAIVEDQINIRLGPLVDVCLQYTMRETLDRGRLRELGYEESTVFGSPTFMKRFEPTGPDKVDLVLSEKSRRCTAITYPIVTSIAPLSAFIHQQLRARGFEPQENSERGRSWLLFARGTERVLIFGGVSSGPYGQTILTFDPAD